MKNRIDFTTAALNFVAAYRERQRLRKERNACKCSEEESADETSFGADPCWKYQRQNGTDSPSGDGLCESCKRREDLHRQLAEQRKRTESARRTMFNVEKRVNR